MYIIYISNVNDSIIVTRKWYVNFIPLFSSTEQVIILYYFNAL